MTMENPRETILLIEDDSVDRMAFERAARENNFPFEYVTARSVGETKSLIDGPVFSAVIMDYSLGDGTAFDLFDLFPETPVIIVTGAGDEEIAVKAMQRGAYDYIVKDADYNYLKTMPIIIRKAIHRKKIEDELRGYKERLESIVEQRTRELKIEMEERQNAENEKIKALTETKILQNQIMLIAEKERQRIGQDLHDGIGQNLTAVSFLMEALSEKLKDRSPGVIEDIDKIDGLVREAIVQIRGIAKILCPVEMDRNGLRAALTDMAVNTENVFKVKCSVRFDGNFFSDDNQTATHLYYIAREAVTNAIKHGNAGGIHIRLVTEGNGFTMTVKDNGSGADDSETGKGMGLRIMKYRAAIIGAGFMAKNAREGGFEITVEKHEENNREKNTYRG